MSGGNALVIGANRGIGLHFTKVLLEHDWKVWGTVRPQTRADPSFDDLKKTGATILDLDYLDNDTIKKAAEEFGSKKLDLLINCAGVNVLPREWLENEAADLEMKFRVMCVGPFLATKAFLPQLKKSDLACVAIMSSDYGSISDNSHGRCISYKIAKAALNQQTVTIANDLRNDKQQIVMLCLDPGPVPTKLSNGNGTVDIDQSVRGMVRIIEESRVADSGSFIKWDGQRIPW